jgi:hypothetical protein
MKLIKVRDNKNRPINNLDVMMGALFGDKVPREFVVDKYYKAGDRVYTFDDDGNLNVWICNLSGTFKTCREPNFSEWSLNSIIEQYKNRPVTIPGETINPQMYECRSAVSERDEYIEYDGFAHFDTNVKGFNLGDYNGEDDIVDIYLRREHSDHYLRREDYKLAGYKLRISLPLEDMVDESTNTTKFLPEGTLVEDTANENYWYNEDGVNKTCGTGVNGIQEDNIDVLASFGKSIEYGYKIASVKAVSVHTVVGSPLNYQLEKPIYRLDEIEVPEHDAIGNNVDGDVQTVSFKVDIEPDRGVYDVVTLSYSKDTQKVSIHSENGYVQQVKFTVVARKDKPLSVFMIGSKAVSPMARFIKVINEYGEVVEVDGEHLIKMPCLDLLRHNSFEFELYVDRVFRSDYEEVMDEEEGSIYIRLLDTTGIDWENTTFLFHIFYCISQDAAIIKSSDTKLVETDKDAFRIALTTQFINKFQWLKMREDSKLIPPEYTVGSKGTANIISEDHYLSIGHKLKADVFSLVFKDNIIRRADSATDTCNSESYPIMEDTRDLTVPFMDYDPEYDDFLIFKSGGVLVSSSKWFLNNKYVNLYIHENPLLRGDYVDFRLLDRDDTVRVDSFFLDVNVDEKSVDTGIDLDKSAFYLLFTVSGEYISNSKYTVDGSTIKFKAESDGCDQPYTPTHGGRLELVVGVYKKEYSTTLYKMIQIETTVDDQREFSFEDNIEYNPSSDNLLIFRKDGMYIGERFYHTDETCGKIIIDKGSGVPLGSYIDVLLIRNMSVRVKPTI